MVVHFDSFLYFSEETSILMLLATGFFLSFFRHFLSLPVPMLRDDMEWSCLFFLPSLC